MTGPLGLLVMAYGTASGPEDIERYYTDIRGGRAPSPEALAELRERYAAVGNTFPLDRITREQADALAGELNASGIPVVRAYVGYKHSPPFVRDAVARMVEDGIEEAVGIVMAPHFSRMSIGGYVQRVEEAAAEHGGPAVSVIQSWHGHPAFLGVLAERVRAALEELPPEDRDRALVIFTAHSLPERILEWGDPYPEQLRATAAAVGARLGLPRDRVTTAWQSAGRTPEPWLGPPLEEVIATTDGVPAVVVCPCGFTADHLEILYDIDIEAAEAARRAGMRLVRTASMNADPAFIGAVGAVVRDHLAQGASAKEATWPRT